MYYSRFCFTNHRALRDVMKFTAISSVYKTVLRCRLIQSVCFLLTTHIYNSRYFHRAARNKNVDQINMKGRSRGNSRPENHNWSDINSRFEHLFSMNDVSEENKREIFLALCGDVYERLNNDASSRRGETLECHHGHHCIRRHRGPHGHGHGHGKPGHRHHAHHHGHHGPHGHGICELHGRFRKFDHAHEENVHQKLAN